MTSPPVLTTRALNRALLARQHLLERAAMPALGMAVHLVGLQAQNPLDPYVALWSRIEAFDPSELAQAIERREAVRLGLLRTTLHLVTADDALELWPVTATVLRKAWQSSPFRKQLDGVDVDAVATASRGLLEADPRTASALARELAGAWPGSDPTALGYVARFLLPVVQVPPRGLWGRTAPATWTTLESWLGRPLGAAGTVDALVLRYLAAFGPATAADIRTWSWLTGVGPVRERLRPRLATFRDEAGRELVDLPDAPRPDPATPAPPRFLPEYDNVALSHADRSRILAPEAVGRLMGWTGSFLVDGFVAGQWRIDRRNGAAELILEPFVTLTEADAEALVGEGKRLLTFLAGDRAERRVSFGVARKAPTDGRPGIGGTRRVTPD